MTSTNTGTKVWMSAITVCACLWGALGAAEARPVEREADCLRDQACVQEYGKFKSEWLECLVQAGLSDKKRKKLEHKVEAMGIRNLKKQELLILNFKRKDCHKSFLKNLSNIQAKKERDLQDLPPPLDRLEKEREDKDE
ncbi:MAG: hypothetical protein HY580_03930 [Nitrospinae bacterium]|nr:hypothetical protein [Nitrospinota bacterium]